MVAFSSGEYTISIALGDFPPGYGLMVAHAVRHDDFDTRHSDGTLLIVTVATASAGWPELVISQRFSPGADAGFHPGILLAPEHQILFIGAGERLLVYDLRTMQQMSEDRTRSGFWHWKRHGDIIVMSAELEMAAWSLDGAKLWSTFVEPPWNYEVEDDRVELEVMGAMSSFGLREGPEK